MPNPIYQTITGEIQCTVEDGVLYVRNLICGPWTRLDISIDEAIDAWKEATDEQTYYWGCITHCLEDKRPSAWYVQPKSEGIALRIEALQRQREEALAAELADRPHPCDHIGGNYA